MARCWTARLVQEAVQPSFAAVAVVGHPQSFSLPRRNSRVSPISSDLLTPGCLGDCLVRPDSLAALAFSLSFFAALPPGPLPLRPLPTSQSLPWLPVLAIVHLSFSPFLSHFVSFRLHFAVVSPYFRPNGGRHEYLNILPLSRSPLLRSFLPPFTVTQRASS